jgi:hypothetical protein
MIHGVLIAESLRPDARLEGVDLVVRAIRRVVPTDTTTDQPPTWTLIEFEAAEASAASLARALAGALDRPGWYADFRSTRETFVVFPERVFRYPRGDSTRRDEARAFGRKLGIPDSQLDWPV